MAITLATTLVGLLIIALGATAMFRVDRYWRSRWSICPACETHWINNEKLCPRCNTRGVVQHDPPPARGDDDTLDVFSLFEPRGDHREIP